MENNYGFDTLAVHGGFKKDPATGVNVVPIYQSNAYAFDSTEHARRLFSLEEGGNIYSRLTNPTVDVFEQKMALLEGGVAACATASGHAAISLIVFNLCQAGDEIISSRYIYGGAVNLLGVTMKSHGITCKFVDPNNAEEVENAITDKTKLIFSETIGNPNADITDIEALAKIAHKHGLPLVIDSTFTSPYLIRPIEYGADIVVHSATKCINGHGNSMGGVVIDSGKFVWKGNPRFPQLNDPDPSYHGIVFADVANNAGFITRFRALLLRDFGPCMSAFNAYMMILGLETLSLRMRKHSDNAFEVAKYLKNHPMVEFVNYAAFPEDKYHHLYKKYYEKNGLAAVFTFGLKATREETAKFIDSLKLLANVANVCDTRSMVVHPATTTHSQLSAEQLEAGGIKENTVRISVGIEDVRDITADLEQAIEAMKK